MRSNFVHLHCHSHFSLLDGLPTPEDYVLKAKEYGSPALAITDHGALYGVIEFYQKAKEHGLNPIIGCEVYVAPHSRFSKQPGIDSKPYHLILLAENEKGYQNLIEIITRAHLEGFYYKPRIDFELLKEFKEGLIALTSCIKGEVPQAIAGRNEEKAIEIIKKYQELLGKERFFLEIQDHPELQYQDLVNEKFIELSKAIGAPLVATSDCHYLSPEDKEAHDVLLCIQTQKTVDDENRLRMEGDFSFRSPEEMTAVFAHVPEAIKNTLEIADRCKVELPFGKRLMPAFQTPFNKEPRQYLKELCEEGIKKRYGETPKPEIIDRLNYELGIINKVQLDTYFLIVHDFVNFAKNAEIMVGPGRGSAAGSIIAYCLNITDIDPLKYGLLFERFLNPERISLPDIDIDFADNRRNEVIDYVVKKYGKDHVSQIITFGTMAARAAIRDVGRALGLSYSTVDVIAKQIPARPGTLLKESLETEPDLIETYHGSDINRKLLDLALKLEGVIRHASVHACAVVISEEPLLKYTPLQNAPGEEETIITQYSMKPLGDIGLLKMDFLGLKNLTILQKTLNIIKRTKGSDLRLKDIPLDDKATFGLMSRGETTGVFQFESGGMKRYLKELKPTRFEDLIAMNALYRPGPMEWIPTYIKSKYQEKNIKYLDPSFEPILKETYGVAVYQEQILELAKSFAGFSLGEADILRKAVGKKIPRLLNKQRKKFLEGAARKGHSEKLSVAVFEKIIEPFAGYGFNKAHAACYALIAYQTAYSKTHFPAEFMAALLTSDQADTDRIVIEINECEAMGIEILPPSVNESLANFTVVDDQHIRFGLVAIKGIGEGSVQEILTARERGGKFKSVEDFARQVPYEILNKKTFEALAYCGALDELGERKAIGAGVEEIARYARAIQTTSALGQTDIFSILGKKDTGGTDFHLEKVTPATFQERLKWEKEYLGLYVSGHPLQGLKKYLKKKINLIETLDKKMVGRTVKMGGLITKTKKIFTRNGAHMMYVTLEDPTGQIEVIIFPKIYQQYKETLKEDRIVVLTGRLDFRLGNLQVVGQEIKEISLEKMIEKAKTEGLFDQKEKFISKAKKETEETEVSSEVPFIITLLPTTAPETLSRIKELLNSYRGRRPAEIHIPEGENLRRIKLPFGIKASSDLREKIQALL